MQKSTLDFDDGIKKFITLDKCKWSSMCVKKLRDGGKVSTNTKKHASIDVEHTIHKKVSLDLPMGNYTTSPKMTNIQSPWYLLVLDVNRLLCVAKHLKTTYISSWKPLVYLQRCGNKLVNTCPNCLEFLKLCSSWFDIRIWSSTTKPHLIPKVQFLIGHESTIKHVFVWGSEQCEPAFAIHWTQIGF